MSSCHIQGRRFYCTWGGVSTVANTPSGQRHRGIRPYAQEEIPAESEASAAESEASANSGTIAVATLYGDDAQVVALAERVMMVAPWVHYEPNGQWQQMTKKDVSLVIRRSMALGVDPLNDKEAHIWRGKHGVNFQLAHTLMAQWVRATKGGHTEPRCTAISRPTAWSLGLPDPAVWGEGANCPADGPAISRHALRHPQHPQHHRPQPGRVQPRGSEGTLHHQLNAK